MSGKNKHKIKGKHIGLYEAIACLVIAFASMFMDVYCFMKTSEEDRELKFAEAVIPMCHESQIIVLHVRISGKVLRADERISHLEEWPEELFPM